MAAIGRDFIHVVVRRVHDATPTIRVLTLADAAGGELPPYAPGAHVDIVLGSGLVRQYSLCGPLAQRDVYCLAIKRVDEGRGGSREIHETVREGDILPMSMPRNFFPLRDHAGPRILLAGGIGITPIWPMVERLREQGARFFLYYSIRTRRDALFLSEIEMLAREGYAQIHVDDEVGQHFLDMGQVLATFSGPRQVYCCGPGPLMAALRERAASCGEAEVFFESFGTSPNRISLAAPEVAGHVRADVDFYVRLRASDQVIPVRADETLLEALETHGVPVESSCRAGACGTCRVRYIRGDVSHMDYVLSDEEREAYMMICVSRGTGEIELDL